ncbi:MAG: hypothetical protein ACSHX0_08420 [Akkermansiaceae bacterium]
MNKIGFANFLLAPLWCVFAWAQNTTPTFFISDITNGVTWTSVQDEIYDVEISYDLEYWETVATQISADSGSTFLEFSTPNSIAFFRVSSGNNATRTPINDTLIQENSQQIFTAETPVDNDRLGTRVAISGDHAVALSHPNVLSEGTSFPYVQVFERDPATMLWSRTQKIDGTNRNFYAADVAIDADYIYVGDPGFGLTLAERHTGEILIYSKQSSGAWVQTDKVEPPENGLSNQTFGSKIALDGEFMAIGSRSVVIYIYRKINRRWVLEKEIRADTSSGSDPSNLARETLKLKNGVLLASTYSSASNQTLKIYERDEGGSANWGEVTELVSSTSQTVKPAAADISRHGSIALAVTDVTTNLPHVVIYNKISDIWQEIDRISDSKINPYFIKYSGSELLIKGSTVLPTSEPAILNLNLYDEDTGYDSFREFTPQNNQVIPNGPLYANYWSDIDISGNTMMFGEANHHEEATPDIGTNAGFVHFLELTE